MAAILFVDIIKYSTLGTCEQRQVAQALNERCARYLMPAFRYQRMFPTNNTFVAAMPTGDGIVVCLDAMPDTPNPGEFLLDLAFELQAWGHQIGPKVGREGGVRLRIGLHTGTLLSIEDVNFQRNFCGVAINMAQRIMNCGQDDHILCSEDAFDEYLRPRFSRQEIDAQQLAGHYKVKHGRNIQLRNITAGGRGNRSAPTVRWTYQVLPYASNDSLGLFCECKRLIVVGFTNDRIAPALEWALRTKPPEQPNDVGGTWLDALSELDVYYVNESLYGYIFEEEAPINLPDAIQGATDRSEAKLKQERKDSWAIIENLGRHLGTRKLESRPHDYDLLPVAGIVAGDIDDAKLGIIKVTHYIWGRKGGSCPTMVLRHAELPEVYEMYANYLRALGKHCEMREASRRRKPAKRQAQARRRGP